MPDNYEYDPDAPPEGSFISEFIGVLTVNEMVTPDNIGEKPEHVQTSVKMYWEKGVPRPVWYLGAEGISVKRTDGQPFRQSDIISLQDKNGKWLGKKMTPDVIATQYRGLGVTSSFTQNSAENSAMGRIFKFSAHEMTYRGKAAKLPGKTISLWPVEIFPRDYVYDGEVREVEPASTDTTAPSNGVPQLSDEAVTQLLREALAGKEPSQLFEALLESTELKGVGKAFGVNLMETATDNSLAPVLIENGVFVLGPDGKLQVPA